MLRRVVEIERWSRGAYCLHYHGDDMMEAVRTFETSVSFYETTWHNIPEDSFILPTVKLKFH
jgi:hypothetical protein